jgi:superfamily I DNA and/or RNA helicase
VTTCGSASNSGVIFRYNFPRVLVDEATMVKEKDLVIAIKNAEQLIMIGDQKQLGPTYKYNFIGSKSLYTRLISKPNAVYNTLLIQYRMHKTLIHVPNYKFYKSIIETGYVRPPDKCFLNPKNPFIFINVVGS